MDLQRVKTELTRMINYREIKGQVLKDKKVLKQILSDLKKYIDNLMYQAKQIAKLSESDNPQIKQIVFLSFSVFL